MTATVATSVRLNAASRASTALVLDDVEAVAGSIEDRPAVADALFGIVGVLGANPGLRRTLAEASVESDDRAGLVRRLFGGKVPPAALELAAGVVGHRWSNAWDLVDALEGAGNQLLLIDAERARHLDTVEDQLFRFGRIVAGDAQLRSALDDRARPGELRARLASSLLGGKADPVTVALVAQGVRSSAHPSVELAVDDLLELTATRRDRSVASVTSARRPHRGPVRPARRGPHPALRPGDRGAGRRRPAHQGRAGHPARRRDHRRQRGHPPRGRSQRPGRLTHHGEQHVAPHRRPHHSTHQQGRVMTELTISADEIRSALEDYVSSYSTTATREEVGVVAEVGDGIARVEGLPELMTNELLRFEDGTLGLAQNLDVRDIGVVILGDPATIEEGQAVMRTGDILSVPVGDAFLGRVVNPLGEPIDGLGEVVSEGRRDLELQAPTVVQRKEVREPLSTGIKAIDAMTAIGRGQRQLIIGDRQTGKTTVCIDAIINQRGNWKSGDPKKQVRCIYVAIGQKGSTIAATRNTLEEAGAMEYTTIVASPASDSAGFKYLAPYTGSAIGQHWMYDGKHVLIVFDDLSKQAEAYRTVSLLLRRPPGREAYPGDVFYLHSRLLERCAKLSDELGGGSMTGLPIIETKGNDVSAYIPTNVISITDGQCFLETDLFNAGVRPAINVGISVSRVGGAAQSKAMKSVAGSPACRPRPVPRPRGVRRLRFRPGQGQPGPARPWRPHDRAAQAARVVAVLHRP